MTHDTWHETHDIWHLTHEEKGTFSQNFKSLANMVREWWCFEDIWKKDYQLMDGFCLVMGSSYFVNATKIPQTGDYSTSQIIHIIAPMQLNYITLLYHCNLPLHCTVHYITFTSHSPSTSPLPSTSPSHSLNIYIIAYIVISCCKSLVLT